MEKVVEFSFVYVTCDSLWPSFSISMADSMAQVCWQAGGGGGGGSRWGTRDNCFLHQSLCCEICSFLTGETAKKTGN